MTANTRTPEELLEEIRRTVVAVCVVEDRYDVVVAPNELFYEEFGLPSIEVRLPIPEEYRTAEIVNNLWTDELDYPECAEAGQSYAHLVGAEALAAAIREVGDTVIAHLVGMEDYLNLDPPIGRVLWGSPRTEPRFAIWAWWRSRPRCRGCSTRCSCLVPDGLGGRGSTPRPVDRGWS